MRRVVARGSETGQGSKDGAESDSEKTGGEAGIGMGGWH